LINRFAPGLKLRAENMKPLRGRLLNIDIRFLPDTMKSPDNTVGSMARRCAIDMHDEFQQLSF
jgi:hypothetical protein